MKISFIPWFKLGKDKIKNNNEPTKKQKNFESHSEWSDRVVNDEIIDNVKECYTKTEIFKKFHPTSFYAICKFTALSLDYNEKLNLNDIKNAFITAAGESVGFNLSNSDANELANYYFSNFYSDEKQKKLYERRMSVDVRD